jgi:hypothetical protein
VVDAVGVGELHGGGDRIVVDSPDEVCVHGASGRPVGAGVADGDDVAAVHRFVGAEADLVVAEPVGDLDHAVQTCFAAL